ncbi:MAG: helix-turn-helix domain-containing protein [Treponema sp.]|nr:helix-turn-helix domain-containing protein [Treponema sp.]
MSLQQVFMANLRVFRKQAGLTQEKLAELCNSDPCYIRQIEGGRRFPSITYIENIAAALNIKPYRLFFEKTNTEDEIRMLLNQNQKQKIKTLLTENVSKICSILDD